jgi:hypothetical protein
VLLLVGGGLYYKAGLAVAFAAGTFMSFLAILSLKESSGQGLEVIAGIAMLILILGIAAAFFVAGLFHSSMARGVKGRV